MSSEDDLYNIFDKEEVIEEEERQFPPEMKKPLKMGKSILPPPKVGGKSEKKGIIKPLRVEPVPIQKKKVKIKLIFSTPI